MLRHVDGVVSPWAAGSPFGLGTQHCPGLEEVEPGAETGAKWLRVHLAPWADVEQRPGVYEFAPEADRFVEAWHDADVQILGVLAYGNPVHSRSADPCVAPTTPEQIEAFAAYVHFTVEHYGRWTKHWEVWNEPNVRACWRPNPFPDAYCALLRAAYRAAKSADPACSVVGGAVAGTASPFVERMLALGAARTMDALSIHPYRPRFEASCEASGYVEELQAVRNLAGDLPVWITEVGWPTAPWEGSGFVGARTQADYLVRLHILSAAAGIERVFWREFRDRDGFGLVQRDFAPKPALAAYRTMTRLLEGAECRGRVAAPHGVWAFGFRKHGQELLVCWVPDGVIEVELLGTGISRWAVDGQVSRPADGPLRTALGASPLYAVGYNLAVASC